MQNRSSIDWIVIPDNIIPSHLTIENNTPVNSNPHNSTNNLHLPATSFFCQRTLRENNIFNYFLKKILKLDDTRLSG